MVKGWVLGAQGLLGRALVKKAPFEIIATGKEVDIADFDQIKQVTQENPGITHIFNAAAFSLVDDAEEKREAAHRTNAIGPEMLGKLASQIGAKLIHISTDYVFDGNGSIPLKESDPVGPVNFYGQTKLEGERRLQTVFPSALILRTSWLFGPGGRNFMGRLLQKFHEEEEIKLSSDQTGRPTYVYDLVDAIFAMKEAQGLYQFANQNEATRFSFGRFMRDLAEEVHGPLRLKRLVAVPSDHFPTRCKRPLYSVFDTTKIEQVLQKPIRPWQEALKEFLCES